ncbi:hypothetical protein FVEG_00486 [Fusarium verticillioides 7600]|uniref:Uncharacterized protein n=1 Tax=Gibberella moniliformis (strain M3125 / FGSC 7600) TaxID=334819 RepID=W7LM29_GIBM7|nr:hypothetical protein FVEG_00486 [Fusarium verticillioides 7600]EWG36469.1 hypothetical protein FVEG_00486 [Fusarium verticillioides 7600]
MSASSSVPALPIGPILPSIETDTVCCILSFQGYHPRKRPQISLTSIYPCRYLPLLACRLGGLARH